MTTTKLIYKKAQSLDAIRLQELNDFLDFLLQKKPKVQLEENLFPVTKLEEPERNILYKGKPLSIEEMDNAINHEAGLHK